MALGSGDEVGARLKLEGRREFTRDADRARESIEDIGDEAKRTDRRARGMGGGLGIASKGIGGLTRAAKMGVVALAAVSAGIAAVTVKSIGLAMEAGETASKFNTVFGDMTGQVNEFVEATNRDFGIPTVELQDAAAMFGVFGKAAGVPIEQLGEFSTSLTQAGLDFASFYNRDPSEVFAALQSGLSGQTEPLRQFGIFMSEASLNAFALEQGLGKTTKEMSDQEKVALRQAFIMANLGDAQGDLERTSGSLANQWRGLKGRIQEASTAFGTAFLPMAEGVVTAINARMQPAVAWLQDGFPVMVENAAAFVEGAMPRMRDAFGIAAQGPGHLGEAVNTLLGPGLEPIVPVFEKIGSVLEDVWTIISDALVPAFQDVADAVPNVLQPMTSLDDVTSFLADNASALRRVLTGLIAGFVAWKVALVASNAILAVHNALTAITDGRLKALIVKNAIVRVGTIAWSAAQWLLNAALTANPIGLVIAAIAALVAIVVIAWKNSETFRNAVLAAWASIKAGASATWNWLKANVFEPIVRFFGTTIPDAGRRLVGWFQALPGRISSAASGMWDGVKNAFRSALNWIIDRWNNFSITLGGQSLDLGPLGSFDVPSITLDTPNIPRLHQGGTTSGGGLANIRPDEEIILLPPAASVVPLTDDARATARSVAGERQPVVLQLVVDRKVLAQATYSDIRDKAARR